MTNHFEYPNVTRSDWEKLSYEYWPRPIEQVIDDRKLAGLPDWFVPAARGVATASDALLQQAGYRPGMRRPRGWLELDDQYFRRTCGDTLLLVRASGDAGLWTVERLTPGRRQGRDGDEVLVFNFGWTPLFTRSYQSAMHLTTHCHVNGPPAGFCWIKAIPEDVEAAIEFAKQRRLDEALACRNAYAENPQHTGGPTLV
jgi:hypothetical protein